MRQKWCLHQNWYFTPEEIEGPVADMRPDWNPEIWERVTLPHTFRLEPYAHRGVKTAQGIGTYCKCFTLDNTLQKKRLFMTFEAVMGVTDVWLNGVLLHTKLADKTSNLNGEVHTNYGGYLPFVVCLNDALNFDGSDNILIVKTDNRDNGQVPPGKPQELLDFTYFGGIYRNVWLEAVENVFITDPLYEDVERGGGILIEYPHVSKEKAIVEIKTQLYSMEEEEQEITLTQEIIGPDENSNISISNDMKIDSQTMKDSVLEVEILNPNLWDLEHPYLYSLITSIKKGDILLDQKKTRFGIRQIEVDRERGLLLNGEVQSLLSGVNRHQDYPIIGNAAPTSMQKRDAVLFKKTGFQVVRGAHYPMSEDFLDACDELGILLLESTPGWQWYPTDSPEPFSSRVRDNIRQMVRRDRNHPCILAYEVVLNETYHVPHGFTRTSALTALAEQKSAKIATESYGYNASPDANGIDEESHFMYGFEEPLEKSQKAVMFLREYADSWIESYGQFESRRVTRGKTDGFYPYGEARNLKKANLMLWQNKEGEYSLAKCYSIRKTNPAFVGCALWTGIDSRGARSEMSPCGVWDGYRLPKTSYWAFASQQENEKVLYLASEWSKKAPILEQSEEISPFGTDELREIYVYSNAESVVLTVEKGQEVLWKRVEKPYIDGETELLPHPPFYFKEVPYSKDTVLRARGYDADGNLIGEEERRTVGSAHHLRLWANFLDIPMTADGNDLVLLHAEILDQHGMLCTDAQHKVFFDIKGDATIVGNGDLLARTNPALAEAGIASTYLRAGKTSGKIQVMVSAKGVLEDEIEILLTAPKHADIEGISFEEIMPRLSGRANLTSHAMIGTAEIIPMIEADGELFPESIKLSNTAQWKLQGENYLEMKCKIMTGDLEADLLFYLDDILRWKGKVRQTEQIKLAVDGATELRVELRSTGPTNILFLSPYFWKEERVSEESELRQNIAFDKPTYATENPQNSGNVWLGKGWFGGRPESGKQEWWVDLEKPYNVRNALIHVGGQMGSDCTFYQYAIYTSLDGIDWDKQTENRRTSWSNGVLDYFTAQDVRYLKVVFIDIDSTLLSGIQKIEIYPDYGVDSVKEYALSGITVEGNDLVFAENCFEYTLPKQEQLTIRAIACDPKAQVRICGKSVSYPVDGKIISSELVTVLRKECGGHVVIEVQSANGQGVRRYHLYF